MFQASGFELARLSHGHGQGDWHDMHDVTPAHDPAEGDPEKGWLRGRIFRCSTCADEIKVVMPENDRRAGGG